MSGPTFAVLIGLFSMLAAYLSKRIIDYLLPPGRHWPIFDHYSQPNKPHDEGYGEPEEGSSDDS